MSIEVLGATAADSGLITVTPSATANTKGSWTTIGTTSSAAAAISIVIVPPTVPANSYLVDIGINADGVTTIVSNLLVDLSSSGSDHNGAEVTLPISLDSSAEIQARCQADGASVLAIEIGVICHSDNMFNTTPVVAAQTYGADTSDSAATQVDAGETFNTKGAWTELASSVGDDIKALWIRVGFSGDTSRETDTFLIDIGTGAAASESVVVGNIPFTVGFQSERMNNYTVGPIEVDISSGTRLAVRMQSNTSTAGNRLLDIEVIGISSFSPSGGGGTENDINVVSISELQDMIASGAIRQRWIAQ